MVVARDAFPVANILAFSGLNRQSSAGNRVPSLGRRAVIAPLGSERYCRTHTLPL
jgi:hypothetical protein